MATYKKNENKTFVNPYTFVPLSETVPKPEDAREYYEKNRDRIQSGYLQCQLEVKTPLAIPDVEGIVPHRPNKKEDENNDSQDKHFSYDFFKLNGKPAIPGSSIRGVIRSVFETVTDSCMRTAIIDTGISQRIDPNDCYSPALLIRNYQNQWELFKAEKISVRFDNTDNTDHEKVFNRVVNNNEVQIGGFRYGDRVSFSYKTISNAGFSKKTVSEIRKYDENDNRDPSYLFIGEAISGKKKEYVFLKKEQIDKTQEEIDAALLGLKETIKIYRNNKINKKYDGTTHFGYRGFERACENGVLPIWYQESDEHLYFSMAAIGRKWFIKAYNELLGEHVPCVDRKSLCPACLLFGMISDNNPDHKSMGSRIRITDALFTGESVDDFLTNGIILKELGSPKPSYLPFYSKNGKSYDNNDGGIRGRKYYWHNSEAEKSTVFYETKETTKRNATMQLVKTGAVFDFKIYFDQITPEQLDTLMAVVTLGKDTKYCHKLGHGKPLGLGSVKINISEVIIRKYENGSYQFKKQKDINISDNLNEELKAVLSFPADLNTSIPISYPWIDISDQCKRQLGGKELKENALGAHQWFSEYKMDKGNNSVLPEILSIDLKTDETNLAKQDLPIYELSTFEKADLK